MSYRVLAEQLPPVKEPDVKIPGTIYRAAGCDHEWERTANFTPRMLERFLIAAGPSTATSLQRVDQIKAIVVCAKCGAVPGSDLESSPFRIHAL